MVNVLRKLVLLTVLFVVETAYADIGDVFESGGFKYRVLDEDNNLEVMVDSYYYSQGWLPKDIVIPENPKIVRIASGGFFGCEEFTSITIPASVNSIGEGAFKKCTGISTLSIPNSVKIIEDNAFQNCYKLTSVKLPEGLESIGDNAFFYCKALTDINIPASIKTIGEAAFCNCEALESIKLPNSLPAISAHIFSGCLSLKQLTIPGSVASIGKSAFMSCHSLTSLVIPNSVTSIGRSAFSSCISLTVLTIPNSVKSIEAECFYGCSALKTLTLPASITAIGEEAFDRNLEKLYLYCRLENYSKCFNRMTKNATIFAHESEIDKIKKTYPSCKVETLPFPFTVSITPLLRGADMSIIPNQNYGDDYGEFEIVKLIIDKDNATIEHLPDYKYRIRNLDFNGQYTLSVTVRKKDSDFEFENYFNVSCLPPSVQRHITSTQTSITIRSMEPYTDETVSSTYCGIRFQSTQKSYFKKPITFNDLQPQTSYEIDCFVMHDGRYFWFRQPINTRYLNPVVSAEALGPSAISAVGNYQEGDAIISKRIIYLSKDEKPYRNIEGDSVIFTGLPPYKYYIITYMIETDKGYKYSSKCMLSTPQLELDILPVKSVSNSSAIVGAKTNLSDQETNVGFQWKKLDAPSSLQPRQGLSPIVDGRIEGFINNLQSTSYYDVRAFYKDAENQYYFSEWTTFDPSDYSYFQPTVHTYPVHLSNSDEIILKGYILPGSDEISDQGFQYRPIDSPKKIVTQSAENDEYVSVTVWGQMISTALDHLQSGTEYTYRTFVKTARGYTYGEEMNFKTPGISSAQETMIDPSERIVSGYYNQYGLRFDTPQTGFNIIVYSDGSTRKVIIK